MALIKARSCVSSGCAFPFFPDFLGGFDLPFAPAFLPCPAVFLAFFFLLCTGLAEPEEGVPGAGLLGALRGRAVMGLSPDIARGVSAGAEEG